MDALVFNCPGCGAPVDIDFKTRKGRCSFCEEIITFPRKRFNSDEKVLNELTILMRSFTERRYEDAKRHGDNVLSVAVDNAPALYARAYYDAFYAINKNSERMNEFFKMLVNIEIDAEEIHDLVKMFLLSTNKLSSYEEKILDYLKDNLSGKDLQSFVDEFSPILISKRTTIDFFTPELVEIYKKIALECSIPKTCYALLQAIETNPDSPIPENKFFLKTKTHRFYETFVLPVGEIIKNMQSAELREKFYRVYQKKQEVFEKKMNGGN